MESCPWAKFIISSLKKAKNTLKNLFKNILIQEKLLKNKKSNYQYIGKKIKNIINTLKNNQYF